MFEAGVLHNGASELPVVRGKDGTVFNSGTLSETHENARQVLVNQVRQCVLADRLGFEYWFQTEHHFQPEGSEFSPNPLFAEAAMAGLTKRIRLGQIANIITQHHPIRIAEQAAMLDVLSGGRLEFGIGRGYQSREVEIFGWPYGSSVQDQERNRAYFEEAYELIMKCWTQESFSHHGQFYTVPPTYTKWHHPQTIAFFEQANAGRTVDQVLNIGSPTGDPTPILAYSTTLKEISVYPQPLQKPHPQVWQPATTPRSIKWAAARGLNAMIDVDTDLGLKRDVAIYYEEAEKQGWPDRLNRGKFKFGWDSEKRRGLAAGRWIHATSNGLGDLKRADLGLEMQWDFYAPFGFARALSDPGAGPMDLKAKVTPEAVKASGVALFGSKDLIIESILKTKEVAGYDDFMLSCAFELAGFSTQETEEQMQYFAEEILPVLRRECGGSPQRPESTVQFVPDERRDASTRGRSQEARTSPAHP